MNLRKKKEQEYRAMKNRELQKEGVLRTFQNPLPQSTQAKKQTKKRTLSKPELFDCIFIDGEGMKTDDSLEYPIDSGSIIPKSSYVYLSAVRSLREVDGISPQPLDTTTLNSTRIKDIYNPKGLSTNEVLDFIIRLNYLKPQTSQHKKVLIGYFLNYDIEHWLKDLSDEEYLYLITRKPSPSVTIETIGETFEYLVYTGHSKHPKLLLSYLRGKIFQVGIPALGYGKGKGRRGSSGQHWHIIQISDASGFFQTSFKKALSSWGFSIPKEVSEGKDARSTFSIEDYTSGYVQNYSLYEGEAGASLLNYFASLTNRALSEGKIPIKLGVKDFFGPGALARKFIKKYKVNEDIPVFFHNPLESGKKWENYFNSKDGLFKAENSGTFYQNSTSWLTQFFPRMNDTSFQDGLRFPFLWAYAGGRIDQAEVGFFSTGIDYDINSAYPTAITRIPILNSNPQWLSGRLLQQSIKARQLGMFLIEWDFPDGWDWYPFPYRSWRKGISFPRRGKGWISSYEYYAVLDTIPPSDFRVKTIEGYLYSDTEGYGTGASEVEPSRQTRIAKAISHIMAVRLEMKSQKNPGHKSLKLIPNSIYGKFIQQIGVDVEDAINGSTTFNPLIAMACTAYTRAMVWRAIAPHREDHQVIAVQTDGILSKVPLSVSVGKGLGEWEETPVRDIIQLQPGQYAYTGEDGKRMHKVRSLSKDADIDNLYHHFQEVGIYTFSRERFITRFMEMIQKNKLEGMRYQWVPYNKNIKVDLHTKRQGNFREGMVLTPGQSYSFPPHDTSPFSGPISLLYEPKFQKTYDEDYLELEEAEISESGGKTVNMGKGGE